MNHELIQWACRGNMQAVVFIAHMYDIAHMADDIADGDADDPRETVELLLTSVLINLPRDPFYREHFEKLHPVVTQAFLAWTTANAFEAQRDPRMLDRGFVLRSLYATLVVAVADIVGGPVNGVLWAKEVSERVWREWTHESVGDYIAEHTQKPADRPADAA